MSVFVCVCVCVCEGVCEGVQSYSVHYPERKPPAHAGNSNTKRRQLHYVKTATGLKARGCVCVCVCVCAHVCGRVSECECMCVCVKKHTKRAREREG